MLKLEMESRGWLPDGRDQDRTIWMMAPEEGGHVLCVAACWPGQLPSDEFARAGWFSPSAWAYGYRPNSVTIWREAGRLTAVWCGALPNFPLHCQGLSRDVLDGELAEEIRMGELSLRLAGVPVRGTTLVWRGEIGDPSSRHGIARALGCTEVIEKLEPLDGGFELSRTLVPSPAAEYRRKVRNQARMRGFALFSLAIMGVGGFLMIQPALSKQKELAVRGNCPGPDRARVVPAPERSSGLEPAAAGVESQPVSPRVAPPLRQ